MHAELGLKDRATVEAFEERIARMDAVVECRRMFGIGLRHPRRGDRAEAYEAFYMTQLAELPGSRA